MIIKSIMSAGDTRQFELNNKTYSSFTPYQGGGQDMYRIDDQYCCDIESYMVFYSSADPLMRSPMDYIRTTAAQLYYNNPHIETYEELCQVFRIWIMAWRGNETLEWAKAVPVLTELEETIMTDPMSIITRDRVKSHWYPLEVELIQNAAERRKTKAKMRADSLAGAIREDIRSESDLFRNNYWNILPTAKYLSSVIDNSLSSVRRHGKGYYTSQKCNTESFIKQFRIMNPGASQVKLKQILEKEYKLSVSLNTLKNYWSASDPSNEEDKSGEKKKELV